MREITAGELSKILKEHEKWIHTDKFVLQGCK
jgi:hypothetical protein